MAEVRFEVSLEGHVDDLKDVFLPLSLSKETDNRSINMWEVKTETSPGSLLWFSFLQRCCFLKLSPASKCRLPQHKRNTHMINYGKVLWEPRSQSDLKLQIWVKREDMNNGKNNERAMDKQSTNAEDWSAHIKACRKKWKVKIQYQKYRSYKKNPDLQSEFNTRLHRF